jgi:hypothetical protein
LASAYRARLQERKEAPFESLEIVALFRYDLDSAGVDGESTVVLIPLASGVSAGVSELEKAGDELAKILGSGRSLPHQYAIRSP